MLTLVLPDVPQFQDTVIDLYQRHTRNTNFTRDKIICYFGLRQLSTERHSITCRLERQIVNELHRRKIHCNKNNNIEK
jgi:hypothetical protein